ncbi:MAG: polysaccharide deacetylase family sporulation protein PdaB [Syntrophomonadaceae bacterium]|mgnify:CR=1 FL=1|nr:polysaccharide deacetylase family sporulation protein PdaB [Syntrophomonadaceae bacterium]
MRIFYFCHLSSRMRVMLTLALALVLVTSSVVFVDAASRLKPIFEVPTEERVLALTFDISWGTKTPGPVLDILKEHQVSATFFLSGPWVEKYPETARRIAAEGHEIGSHGYQHINLSTLSFLDIKSEIMKAHQSIQKVTGRNPSLIRTPNGDYDNSVINAAQECGYRVIQWGTDSLDWKNPGVNVIVQRVLTRAHPGDIILMHASDTCLQTAEALPSVLRGLKEQGFRLVTVSELLELGNR